MELAGRVAVVTGASSGIGEATARALAREGMHVVAAARRLDRLEQLASGQRRIQAVRADVTVPADVLGLAAHVHEQFGACHALVNNAGIPGGRMFEGLEDVPEVELLMDVNFLGTVRCTAAFADLLFASAPSQVVNVASVAGKLGVGPPGYHASKFATVGFSEALDLAWTSRGVRVTQLNPGLVVTEGFPQRDLLASPVRRLILGPEPVAEAIVDALRRRSRERTVPRWYRPFVVIRHVVPGLFWPGARRVSRLRRAPRITGGHTGA
jgi:NAD(P)-dependent dehydrogenase (short-subunit alcohol dehydrogenase family)